MTTIYVVFGSAGNYDDWRNWSAMAFENEQDAKEYAIKCTEWDKLHRKEWLHANHYPSKATPCLNPFDPNYNPDYFSVTDYNIEKLELVLSK